MPMISVEQQIQTAIDLMANSPAVFSAKDVADYIGWEGIEDRIEESLATRCVNETLLRLEDDINTTNLQRHYLSVEVVRKWWTDSTLRWARTDITHVTSDQLAGAMSIAFDNHRWETPPTSLLNEGRRRAMVADGCIPGTFVFPWVSLFQHMPILTNLFHTTSISMSALPWLDSSLVDMTEEALNTLPIREAKVIKVRFGLQDGRRRTLEEVGKAFAVTRERIRQIESKALQKLRHPTRNRYFLTGFAADFVHSGGSLLIEESQTTPLQSLLGEVLGLDLEAVEELGIRIITAVDLSKYRASLRDEHYRSSNDLHHLAILLPFLPKADVERLRAIEEEFWNNRITRHWTRPRMILEALRSLGRSAHYREIAEVCNELFPNKQASTRSWHAALTLPSCDALGIVWIGSKGMYGLKEHGYSRPTMDLFETVAEIVESTFARTQQPVSEDMVVAELNKYRRDANVNSVKMALSFNDRLESVAPSRYAPKNTKLASSGGSKKLRYDIASAFRAFSEAKSTDK